MIIKRLYSIGIKDSLEEAINAKKSSNINITINKEIHNFRIEYGYLYDIYLNNSGLFLTLSSNDMKRVQLKSKDKNGYFTTKGYYISLTTFQSSLYGKNEKLTNVLSRINRSTYDTKKEVIDKLGTLIKRLGFINLITKTQTIEDIDFSNSVYFDSYENVQSNIDENFLTLNNVQYDTQEHKDKFDKVFEKEFKNICEKLINNRIVPIKTIPLKFTFSKYFSLISRIGFINKKEGIITLNAGLDKDDENYNEEDNNTLKNLEKIKRIINSERLLSDKLKLKEDLTVMINLRINKFACPKCNSSQAKVFIRDINSKREVCPDCGYIYNDNM